MFWHIIHPGGLVSEAPIVCFELIGAGTQGQGDDPTRNARCTRAGGGTRVIANDQHQRMTGIDSSLRSMSR